MIVMLVSSVVTYTRIRRTIRLDPVREAQACSEKRNDRSLIYSIYNNYHINSVNE
jgi:hypothetical protein